jgi:rhodanese-related sulfurtransferase
LLCRADTLYDSVRKILALGDAVLLYPAHGAGSVCGAHLAQRSFSTLGFEKVHSPVLQLDRSAFIERKMSENLYRPPYLNNMERANLVGAPGSLHIYVGELPQRLGSVPRDRPVATYCDSGARAIVAASILQRSGYEHVEYFPGSFQAWTAHHFPVEEFKEPATV